MRLGEIIERGRARWRGEALPQLVRLVSAEQLGQLMATAMRLHLSGIGRPQWLAEHADDIELVSLTPLLPDSTPVRSYRCRAVAVLTSGKSFWFPVDIRPDDFFALPRPSRWQLYHLISLLGDSATFVLVEGPRTHL